MSYIMYDTITNGYNINVLDIITIFVILCSIFVIISKNPIVSVLFLIGLFLSISVYLMMLGINFIGLSYLLVYVGAISILFLFILMLINVRISEIVNTTSNSIPLGIIIGILFFSTLHKALPTSKEILNNKNYNTNILGQQDLGLDLIHTTIINEIYKYIYGLYDLLINISSMFNKLYYSNKVYSNNNILNENSFFLTYSHNWDNMLAEVSHINTLGNILYTSFPIWILLTSIILLLAMVGAILITLKN